MGINFADEKVNIKSTVQFGSKRKITNPVQEEIRKSGLKTVSYTHLTLPTT